MELWIRSQDKMELRPNPKLAIEVIQERYYITDRYDFDKSNILGIYKTKERALEVLSEIQERINVLSAINVIGISKDTCKAFNKVFEKESITNLSSVYEMPQE